MKWLSKNKTMTLYISCLCHPLKEVEMSDITSCGDVALRTLAVSDGSARLCLSISALWEQ